MILDVWIDQQFQSIETLNWVLPGTDPKVGLLVEDHQIDYQGQSYYIDEIKQNRDGSQHTVTVTANVLWMRLGGYKKVGSFLLTAQDAPTGLEQILDGTPYTRGVGIETASTGASGLQTLEAQDTSVLDLIWRWAKLFQLEVVFDTVAKTVDFVASTGVDNGMSFRYARNLVSVTRTARAPTATRLYPYGREGLTIATETSGGEEFIEDYAFYTAQGISGATARADFRRDEIYSDQDITTAESLIRAARARLAITAYPWVKYECKVIDLSTLTGINELDVNVGDTVRVTDAVFDFDFETRVTRRKFYPLEPWRNEVELATLDTNGPTQGTSSRSSNSGNWVLYKHDSAEYRMRYNSSYTLHRIALAFVDGEAVFGYDISFTGVGTGSLSVSALNYTAGIGTASLAGTALDTTSVGVLIHPVLTIPYTNGQVVHQAATWAIQELGEQWDFRIRAVATASPASAAAGINIARNASRFWILAKGATLNSPTLPNRTRFDFIETTGLQEQFTVPEGVTALQIECVGAAGMPGRAAAGTLGGIGGSGSRVVHTRTVYPGQIFEVFAAGHRYPNGGIADITAVNNAGGDGGGSSWVANHGGTIASAIVVAAGGGGGGFYYTLPGVAGADAGFYVGQDGLGNNPGHGADQYAGGGGAPGASSGIHLFGGNGYVGTGSFAGPPGAGGGGWFGGGGGGAPIGNGAGNEGGGGGAGAGFLADGGWDITLDDGFNSGVGWIEFSWEDPDT